MRRGAAPAWPAATWHSQRVSVGCDGHAQTLGTGPGDGNAPWEPRGAPRGTPWRAGGLSAWWYMVGHDGTWWDMGGLLSAITGGLPQPCSMVPEPSQAPWCCQAAVPCLWAPPPRGFWGVLEEGARRGLSLDMAVLPPPGAAPSRPAPCCPPRAGNEGWGLRGLRAPLWSRSTGGSAPPPRGRLRAAGSGTRTRDPPHCPPPLVLLTQWVRT